MASFISNHAAIRRRAVQFACTAIVFINLTGCDRDPNPDAAEQALTAAESPQRWNNPTRTWTAAELTTLGDGEKLFQRNCSGCHGPDGGGKSALRAPALRANPLVLGEPTPLLRTVLYGRKVMPAFRDTLDDTELAALASFLRNAWGNNRGDIVDPAYVTGLRSASSP